MLMCDLFAVANLLVFNNYIVVHIFNVTVLEVTRDSSKVNYTCQCIGIFCCLFNAKLCSNVVTLCLLMLQIII